MKRFDALVIGGGPGGYVAAIRLGQLGKRAALVERVRAALGRVDLRGLIVPEIEAGAVGGNARALGAACAPIVAQFLLNTHSGFTPG